ncbi:ADP-ribosylglycohydrolase family protein [Mycobacterium sp. ITM-2016-00317]|uniref:ADP-ribosylglycohydrolase family protein n=1 Tax=Mycobacterium sp. ITM-2016-00317 TaxID=2099694 RepID=UPI00287FF3E9|nr:ADP-ribosylglycohydrolase family protein [Mycobacterium sp. ITM-2016-00317]WNG88512.1 ADP-ribosylglycohydrolase family protein [Mycobacterium sp. ITM-2016-00317]
MTDAIAGLDHVQRDRAAGALVGAAAGDAFGTESRPSQPWQWTGDTATAIAIAEIAGTAADLRAGESLDYLRERWRWWARTAKDLGRQPLPATTATASARLIAAAPVALAYLNDEAALVQAVRTVSELIDADVNAGDACVLWSLAIRHAVLTGELDVRVGLRHIDIARQSVWLSVIRQAERSQASVITPDNGSAAATLQAAWSAIVNTPVPVENPAAGVFRVDHLRVALEASTRAGGATVSTAGAAGALLGAAYGVSAVPYRWRRALKGPPGLSTRGLVRLADKIIDRGEPGGVDYTYQAWRGFPKPRRHPRDDEIWIGAAPSLHRLPAGVDAVVSLRPVAEADIPHGAEHLEARLIDEVGANANVDFVLLDTVRAIEAFRAEGRTVFVHCADGTSVTPSVAALYSARRRDQDVFQALFELCDVGPGTGPHRELRAALRRLRPADPAQTAQPTAGTEADGWSAYWTTLFPPRPTTPFLQWKRSTSGADIARRLWQQREYLRRTYESVYGEDGVDWPVRHPGVVLDAVPRARYAACLGCAWIEALSRDPLRSAQRHEMSGETV